MVAKKGEPGGFVIAWVAGDVSLDSLECWQVILTLPTPSQIS